MSKIGISPLNEYLLTSILFHRVWIQINCVEKRISNFWDYCQCEQHKARKKNFPFGLNSIWTLFMSKHRGKIRRRAVTTQNSTAVKDFLLVAKMKMFVFLYSSRRRFHGICVTKNDLTCIWELVVCVWRPVRSMIYNFLCFHIQLGGFIKFVALCSIGPF